MSQQWSSILGRCCQVVSIAMSVNKKITCAVLAIVSALLVAAVVREFRNAFWLADQSAMAALDKEIGDQLAAIPPGQDYPASLSELPLTYPDGGNSDLLTRFQYTSAGDTCSYRTSIFGKEVVRSFPASD